MTPGKFDLVMYRGDSYHWQFVLWENSIKTIPVDLTGATAAAEIREKSAGTTVIDLVTTITLPNIVDVKMEPALYVGTPAKGVWDLQITFSNGDVATPIAGVTTITGDVTDSLPVLLNDTEVVRKV